ncbi:EspA/EspE family type VII secretion system effector, partial [Mycobacterium marinum]
MDAQEAQRRAAQEQAASERYWGDPERRWEKWRELCRGTLVCGWTLTFLAPWPGLLGDGAPERGDRLSGSASMFDDLGVRVAALDPHGGWRGGAAQAYGACTRVQCQQVMVMADLDRLTAQLVSAQAHAVKTTHDALTGLIYGVSGLAQVCGLLELQGLLPQSLGLAIGFCALAVLYAVNFLISLWVTTSRHGNDMQAVAQRVSGLIAALPTGSRAALGRSMPASAGAGVGPAEGVSQVTVADHTAPSPLTAEL